MFTPLHRLLGRDPGPLTDEMIDEAVSQHLRETSDLDWKADLIPAKQLKSEEFVKDIAAMANIGGGMLVFGIKQDSNAQAERRVDVGEVPEAYQRTMTQVAISAISPPVFNLEVVPLGVQAPRALAVLVPQTYESPHLVYRGEYFGAPMRSGPDTHWMREREIEAQYRARFDARRVGDAQLESLYEEVAVNHPADSLVWMVAVARPFGLTPVPQRRSQRDAHAILSSAKRRGGELTTRMGRHPFLDVGLSNLRPGRRAWLAPPVTIGVNGSQEAWISVHDDGSCSVAAAVGGSKYGDDHLEGWVVDTWRVEAVLADFMGLVAESGRSRGLNEYVVRIGLEWLGREPIDLKPVGNWMDYFTPLRRFTPVVRSVQTDVSDEDYLRQTRDIAQDVVNQGGVAEVGTIR